MASNEDVKIASKDVEIISKDEKHYQNIKDDLEKQIFNSKKNIEINENTLEFIKKKLSEF